MIDAQLVGSLAGTLTTVAYVPQVVKVFRSRSTEDLSWPTFLCLWLGIVLWIVYGVMLGENPIIVANVITLGLASMILAGKAYYSTRRNDGRRRFER